MTDWIKVILFYGIFLLALNLEHVSARRKTSKSTTPAPQLSPEDLVLVYLTVDEKAENIGVNLVSNQPTGGQYTLQSLSGGSKYPDGDDPQFDSNNLSIQKRYSGFGTSARNDVEEDEGDGGEGSDFQPEADQEIQSQYNDGSLSSTPKLLSSTDPSTNGVGSLDSLSASSLNSNENTLKHKYTLSDSKNPQTDADDFGMYSNQFKANNNPLSYKINDGSAALQNLYVDIKKPFGSNSDPTNLKVCVFGDFRADLYTQTPLNLSRLVEENECNLNLFIGKITWEQRPKGFSFNPFLMLHDNNPKHLHGAFANVPSIFGHVGHDLNETTFFQSTEVNGVAFIQTTVTLVTVANLTFGTEQFEKVQEYFRETMLNELECKLQVNWLMLNSVDRFFEILKRYKIDLLTSCGIEGMSKLLEERKQNFPDEQLPTYLQTTLAECGAICSAPNLQNECSYAVLDIAKTLTTYSKRDLDGKVLQTNQINKNTEEPDKCVEIEL